MTPMTMPAVITALPPLIQPSPSGRRTEHRDQQRADGQQREQAVDDGGDAGEHLEQRLGDGTHPLRRRIPTGRLRRTARSAPPPAARRARCRSVPQSSGMIPSSEARPAREARRPFERGEEIGGRVEPEELDGVEQQRQHDAERWSGSRPWRRRSAATECRLRPGCGRAGCRWSGRRRRRNRRAPAASTAPVMTTGAGGAEAAR